jgi:hypothetical protein
MLPEIMVHAASPGIPAGSLGGQDHFFRKQLSGLNVRVWSGLGMPDRYRSFNATGAPTGAPTDPNRILTPTSKATAIACSELEDVLADNQR